MFGGCCGRDRQAFWQKTSNTSWSYSNLWMICQLTRPSAPDRRINSLSNACNLQALKVWWENECRRGEAMRARLILSGFGVLFPGGSCTHLHTCFVPQHTPTVTGGGLTSCHSAANCSSAATQLQLQIESFLEWGPQTGHPCCPPRQRSLTGASHSCTSPHLEQPGHCSLTRFSEPWESSLGNMPPFLVGRHSPWMWGFSARVCLPGFLFLLG